MFQRLDELQTGSLYILTGQAGAGKSHLAASARRSGTLWVLDTEGAAQNLSGKAGIHRRIQVMQSLSLKALVEAMEEIRGLGKPGDTVLLDSISKVFQAMRAYAQRRAGAETDRKTGVAYDEHASINRNMQAVYTGLTELKQAVSEELGKEGIEVPFPQQDIHVRSVSPEASGAIRESLEPRRSS